MSSFLKNSLFVTNPLTFGYFFYKMTSIEQVSDIMIFNNDEKLRQFIVDVMDCIEMAYMHRRVCDMECHDGIICHADLVYARELGRSLNASRFVSTVPFQVYRDIADLAHTVVYTSPDVAVQFPLLDVDKQHFARLSVLCHSPCVISRIVDPVTLKSMMSYMSLHLVTKYTK